MKCNSSVKTILFVDDDPMVTKLFQRVTFENNMLCITVNSVESAIVQIDINPPDIIISDYQMPGLDGVDFKSILLSSSSFKDIPFIILTASKDSAFLAKAKMLNVKVLDKELPVNYILHEIVQELYKVDARNARELKESGAD